MPWMLALAIAGQVAQAGMSLASGYSAAAGALRGSEIEAQGQRQAGDYAYQIGQLQRRELEYEARQIEQQAPTQIGLAQRAAYETRLNAALTSSRARAGAAAAGVASDVGTAATNEREIERRGEYAALMDMWQGKNAAAGLRSQAEAKRYSAVLADLGGRAQQLGAYNTALATLASGSSSARAAVMSGWSGAIGAAAGAIRIYGAHQYPTVAGGRSA